MTAEQPPERVSELVTFRAAADVFRDLVQDLATDAWTGPGLGEWDLRALVGHTSRSLVTVETYLSKPADREEIPTSADYYAAIAPLLSGDEQASIVERGRAAGEALGADPAGHVRELVARVVPLAEAAGDPLITTIAGGMRLRRYLPTRTFELVVHSHDIATAAGLPAPEFDHVVLTEAVNLASSAAVALGKGSQLLAALTGRAELPRGFSVV